MNRLFKGNLAAREQSRALFQYILSAEPVTRPMILSHLKLPPTTLNRALDRLLLDGLITEIGQAESTGGRPASLFQVISEARLMMGISIAGQVAQLMLLDLHHRPVASKEVILTSDPDSLSRAEQLANAAAGLLAAIPDTHNHLLGAGVNGTVILPEAEALALQSMLHERLGHPVLFVDGMAGAVLLLQKHEPSERRKVALLSVGHDLSLEEAGTGQEMDVFASTSAIEGMLMPDMLSKDTAYLVRLAELVTIPAIGRRFAALREHTDFGFLDFQNALQQAKKKAVRLLDVTADALALSMVNAASVSGATDFVLCGELSEIIPSIIDLTAEKLTWMSARANIPVRLIQHDFGSYLPAAGAAALVLSQVLERSTHVRSSIEMQ